MNIIYLQKKLGLLSFLSKAGGVFNRFSVFVLAMSLLLGACVIDQDTQSKRSKLYKPSFALFGDSISAFWPVEEQFPEFETYKKAFPGRRTYEIQEAAKNETGRYRSCMLNGGVNDFLNQPEPSWEEVDATVQRQLQTLEILNDHCDYIIVLNVWTVQVPWPVKAASMINLEMKKKVTFLPRIDPEDLIHSEMLLDGGHLTDEGYGVLSQRVREYLRASLPEFWLQYL
ncbi:SGNH/GDSL hydrolase family protein [Leptospira saintgironsiae]|uniref:SGNH/GDSL hydrolase family protein n=1 Tax=Leptospira saintgironsiae TaxID=2023183 RepID=A0A2M9Y861_9LEPT|nr:SGNH/GDSL hydrolase family protein [Leptospira saintgironsiae]PJZ47744.1 SGNH/GDSL hydrolase family protein [Leptospira saintgironsiae]